jgi:protoheme IX farnesyltransferase
MGRISRADAAGFGGVLALFSVMLMDLAVNTFAAGLLAFTILFYAVVYTLWLKRSTPQNIVIGGAAGALPPVVGGARAARDLFAVSLVYLFLLFAALLLEHGPIALLWPGVRL